MIFSDIQMSYLRIYPNDLWLIATRTHRIKGYVKNKIANVRETHVHFNIYNLGINTTKLHKIYYEIIGKKKN